ncbi:DUF2303 family protein [Pseudomonas oryzihabitans]|uniref:DUF2303 family protein n=1 Tax=Pseudomonas oryzihabitans TaxID=47885 RepID=UPI0028959B2E|nr:DUF2303 family protein [Pseudomonas oryzihabitans]MDT3720322.1 DUF2303 family protein [Pseudomonas oryzihabitans]
MSLTKDALQLIIADAVAATGKPLNTPTPAILVPEGFKLVNLETYGAGRVRFRGVLSTSSLQDFADYVNEQAATDPFAGFVDPDDMTAQVFFNLGDVNAPGHADNYAVLRLQATAAYKALQHAAGKTFTQRELAEFLEDWHLQLKPQNEEGRDMSVVEAIANVRNIVIKAKSERGHTEGNFNASRSAMDEIEANSQDSRVASIAFTLVPYEGLSEITALLRVSIHTSNPSEHPTLKLRWVGEEGQKEEIARDFKDVLGQEIGSAARLTLGTFKP